MKKSETNQNGLIQLNSMQKRKREATLSTNIPLNEPSRSSNKSRVSSLSKYKREKEKFEELSRNKNVEEVSEIKDLDFKIKHLFRKFQRSDNLSIKTNHSSNPNPYLSQKRVIFTESQKRRKSQLSNKSTRGVTKKPYKFVRELQSSRSRAGMMERYDKRVGQVNQYMAKMGIKKEAIFLPERERTLIDVHKKEQMIKKRAIKLILDKRRFSQRSLNESRSEKKARSQSRKRLFEKFFDTRNGSRTKKFRISSRSDSQRQKRFQSHRPARRQPGERAKVSHSQKVNRMSGLIQNSSDKMFEIMTVKSKKLRRKVARELKNVRNLTRRSSQNLRNMDLKSSISQRKVVNKFRKRDFKRMFRAACNVSESNPRSKNHIIDFVGGVKWGDSRSSQTQESRPTELKDTNKSILKSVDVEMLNKGNFFKIRRSPKLAYKKGSRGLAGGTLTQATSVMSQRMSYITPEIQSYKGGWRYVRRKSKHIKKKGRILNFENIENNFSDKNMHARESQNGNEDENGVDRGRVALRAIHHKIEEEGNRGGENQLSGRKDDQKERNGNCQKGAEGPENQNPFSQFLTPKKSKNNQNGTPERQPSSNRHQEGLKYSTPHLKQQKTPKQDSRNFTFKKKPLIPERPSSCKALQMTHRKRNPSFGGPEQKPQNSKKNRSRSRKSKHQEGAECDSETFSVASFNGMNTKNAPKIKKQVTLKIFDFGLDSSAPGSPSAFPTPKNINFVKATPAFQKFKELSHSSSGSYQNSPKSSKMGSGKIKRPSCMLKKLQKTPLFVRTEKMEMSETGSLFTEKLQKTLDGESVMTINTINEEILTYAESKKTQKLSAKNRRYFMKQAYFTEKENEKILEMTNKIYKNASPTQRQRILMMSYQSSLGNNRGFLRVENGSCQREIMKVDYYG